MESHRRSEWDLLVPDASGNVCGDPEIDPHEIKKQLLKDFVLPARANMTFSNNSKLTFALLRIESVHICSRGCS
jgi:hypothetical protein